MTVETPSERQEREEREDREHRLQRLSHQLSQQWAHVRAGRRSADPLPISTGETNLSRAQVPWGVDLAAAWSWRLLVIAAAGYLVLWLLAYFAVITMPLIVAMLISALASPAVRLMERIHVPRQLAALFVVIGGLVLVGGLLTLAGQQIVNGAQDLAGKVVEGLGRVQDWLKNGPLNASESQINQYITQMQEAVTEGAKRIQVTQVTEVGTAIGHVVAGLFIVLFATYFFLADGSRIWAWFVRLAPRVARGHVDGSGRVAWVSLTKFVQATVMVAAADAIGIAIVATILGVPFVLAIGVLVFLGAFIPMVGATIAGSVAVLVALVAGGPWTALLMLGGVILVQQIEGHILQPFLMGRFISVHPLGVIVALGMGVLVAGIAGALIAVPLAAMVNSVVQYLAREVPGSDPVEELRDDLGPDRGGAPPVPPPADRIGVDNPENDAEDDEVHEEVDAPDWATQERREQSEEDREEHP